MAELNFKQNRQIHFPRAPAALQQKGNLLIACP
jgi:hypothetical protein